MVITILICMISEVIIFNGEMSHYLKLNISQTTELVVDCIHNPAAQKISTIKKVSRLSPKISVTDSVSDQSWNTVTNSPSVPELWRGTSVFA